jgi:hypothetical protein|tara:strand:- start:338 stop:544 length:207 start_codon:yes stop_codon:yes gene_type:complete
MGNIFTKKNKPCVALLVEDNVSLEQITIDCFGDCAICKIKGLDGFQINNLETGLLIFICKKCYITGGN